MHPPSMSEHHHHDYGSPDFVADKVIGIILMILNACVGIGGLVLIAGAGAIGASGVQVEGKTIAAGGLGFLGVVAIVLSIVGIVIGYGIMKSARWGFIAGAVVFGINAVTNLAGLAQDASNVLGLLIAPCRRYLLRDEIERKPRPEPLR